MSDEILNDSGLTELHLACYHGELDWVQNCLEGGLDTGARDNGGYTPLHWVVDMGVVGNPEERLEIVRLLIASGADIHARDVGGVSVVFRAIMAGNCELVEQLIEACADVRVPDNKGYTPLAQATSDEYLEMIEIIEKALSSAPSEVEGEEKSC